MTDTAALRTVSPATGAPPTGGSWATRLLDVLLLVVALVMFVDLRFNTDIDDAIYAWSAGLWIVLALTFVGVRLRRMRRARRGDPNWTSRLQDSKLGYLLVTTTVVTVVNAIQLLLTYSGDSGQKEIAALVEQGADPDQVTGFVTGYSASALLLIILAWAVLHLTYAERYARIWTAGRAAGIEHLEFPGTGTPTLVDFVYFAATLGVTFATSDIGIATSQMRAKVLFHGLLSFLYNTVIVAATVGVLTG